MSETPETAMNSEMQAMLPKAVKKVVQLCVGDITSIKFGTQTPEQRDQLWNDAAAKLKPFADKITGLREALKAGYAAREVYSPVVIAQMLLYFKEIADEKAKGLLIDLLIARLSKSPGNIDHSLDVGLEAEAMVSELLGIKKGLEGEALESELVTFEEVVKSVLSGDLKLTRQTQLEKK